MALFWCLAPDELVLGRAQVMAELWILGTGHYCGAEAASSSGVMPSGPAGWLLLVQNFKFSRCKIDLKTSFCQEIRSVEPAQQEPSQEEGWECGLPVKRWIFQGQVAGHER